MAATSKLREWFWAMEKEREGGGGEGRGGKRERWNCEYKEDGCGDDERRERMNMKSEWGRLWRVGGCGHDSGSSSFPHLLGTNLLFCPYSSILLPHLMGHPITDNWQVRRDLGLDQADFVLCLIVWAQTTPVQHAMSHLSPRFNRLPQCCLNVGATPSHPSGHCRIRLSSEN